MTVTIIAAHPILWYGDMTLQEEGEGRGGKEEVCAKQNQASAMSRSYTKVGREAI